MSTLLADPIHADKSVRDAGPSSGSARSASGSAETSRGGSSGASRPGSGGDVRSGGTVRSNGTRTPTGPRKNPSRTRPRVGARGAGSVGSRPGGVGAPRVRNPMPLRDALAVGHEGVGVARTNIVAAPVRYRLTERGIAAVSMFVLVLVCIASVAAVARFVSVTSEPSVGAERPVVSAPVVPGPVET